jgi:hypothetical protein
MEILEKEYSPERLSRRGELIAWGCTAATLATLLFLRLNGVAGSWLLTVLLILLLISGAGISLSNWVDRHTRLWLHPDGVEFSNGLRHVRLAWPQIRSVRVAPSQWGSQVSVIGDMVHFEFRTLGEVVMSGQVRGRMGFIAGEAILQRITGAAQLQRDPQPDGTTIYHQPGGPAKDSLTK